MTDFDALFESLFAWAKLAISKGGIDEAMVAGFIADQRGERPPLPHMTFKFITWDEPTAQRAADVRYANPATSGRIIAIDRTATLSVQGFGLVTRSWLELLALMLDDDDVIAALTAAGVTLRELGSITDLTDLVDTAKEPRFLRQFACDYRATTAPTSFAALQQAVIDPLTFQRYTAHPNPVTTSLTVTV